MKTSDNLLQTAWVRQLKTDWKNANYYYFNDSMFLPDIGLSHAEKTLGGWKGGKYRKLSISVKLIANYKWKYVQEVLYHEMVHQYVDEILGVRDSMPHGEIFKRICLENGIDPAATGDIQSWVEKRNNNSSVSSEYHKIFDKIHKLLALARSPNEHEAQNAMSKAHEFLFKHNLSLMEVQTKLNYNCKQIGEVGRRNPIKSIIGSIICRFFFVEAIWTFGYDQNENRNGQVLEIYGTPENIEMAEYVYYYLQNISEFLWLEYKRRENISGNRHRRTFIYGLLDGFYNKLNNLIVANQSKKLVWKGDPRLKEFYRRKNPKLVYSSSRYSSSCQDAYNSGKTQGTNLVINKGIQWESKGGGRLLGSALS